MVPNWLKLVSQAHSTLSVLLCICFLFKNIFKILEHFPYSYFEYACFSLFYPFTYSNDFHARVKSV